ncbi:hypothetical protein CH333_09930 [candidate division WOR-3 bacterium JGI_Cruoil_03_44_89]|uniref:Uncharacterized protein n=1 Tax=candidate division WOR-3 bacterium JGI_Cruoil_03_44_89 TaxID=1973748 RepID=A0A235BMT9_UNCW3|nr:MAG: hypothetical protein CH333_09930 [candidate division WOR-3 bacterium JGI_Cruoil_03_44_89]
MIKPIRYLLSLPMKKQIVDVGEVVKNARSIAVIFPVDEENTPNYGSNIAKLVRAEFAGCKIYAILSEGRSAMGFDDITYLVPGFAMPGRKFLTTKEILRNLNIDISFDLNKVVDVITYLVGAHLRIGTIDSPFLNVVVKGVEEDPRKMFSIIGTTLLNSESA